WVFFFFFQAEDGIRDLTVTGVQTCALPIFVQIRDASVPVRALDREGPDPDPAEPCVVALEHAAGAAEDSVRPDRDPDETVRVRRSEERRVGKECVCGWGGWCGG